MCILRIYSMCFLSILEPTVHDLFHVLSSYLIINWAWEIRKSFPYCGGEKVLLRVVHRGGLCTFFFDHSYYCSKVRFGTPIGVPMRGNNFKKNEKKKNSGPWEALHGMARNPVVPCWAHPKAICVGTTRHDRLIVPCRYSMKHDKGFNLACRPSTTRNNYHL